jgi:pyridoxal phosphate enzyme (YggS family)
LRLLRGREYQRNLNYSLEYSIMDSIASNLQGLSQTISLARARVSQPVTLIAVSKTQPASAVLEAVGAGQRDFGENYIQEGVDKVLAIRPLHADTVWHMIGPIQSNKTRLVAEHFDWVHTVDRLKIAQRLAEQRPAWLAPLHVLIQVNIDHEPSKSGVFPDEALVLARAVAALPALKLRGLMCIPEKSSSQAFARMAVLLKELNAHGFELDVLSMGMSADFADAIAQGATHVRVGSAIFGARAAKS